MEAVRSLSESVVVSSSMMGPFNVFSQAVSKRKGNKSRIIIPLFVENSVSHFNGVLILSWETPVQADGKKRIEFLCNNLVHLCLFAHLFEGITI